MSAQFSKRFFVKLILLIPVTALIAGALTYPIWISIRPLTDFRPDRVMHRTWELLLALGIWRLLQTENLANKESFGFGLPRATFLRQMSIGFLGGLLAMAPLVTGLLWAQIRTWDGDSAASIALSFLTGAVAGFAVAFIEESIVRGAAFTGLERESGALTAIVISSALFAAGHFFRGNLRISPEHMDFWSGFRFVADACGQLRDVLAMPDALLALFAFAVLLSLMRLRTGAIALPIGLHAGGVAAISMLANASTVNPHAEPTWLIPTYNHVMGWMAFAWISLVATVYWTASAKRANSKAQSS